jgi:hypothetical protein
LTSKTAAQSADDLRSLHASELNDVEMEVSRRYIERDSVERNASPRSPQAKLGLDCPSIHPQLARSVIGVFVKGSSRVNFVAEQLPVPVSLARAAGPEVLALRARFAGRCITSGCKHWTGANCRLGEVVADIRVADNGQLPHCSIRKTCRWFLENGAMACNTCQHLRYLPMCDDEVVLDVSATPVDED